MPDYEKLRKNLEARGFDVTYFDTAAEAVDYLDRKLDGKAVGHGGSITLRDMGLIERLQRHATVPQPLAGGQLCRRGGLLRLSDLGERPGGDRGAHQLDGTGNRVASTIFGHEEVYFLVGSNKIAPDYDAALWRARNVASPKNAQRLGKKTPCAVRGDKCYDCKSPERICRALAVLWEKPTGIGRAEVVLIDEPLGY